MEFADVAAEHGRALVRVAYLLCHDSGRAEDLAQEALMKALSRWRRHGPPDHPFAYLRRIVVTEYLGWRRKRASTEIIAVRRLRMTMGEMEIAIVRAGRKRYQMFCPRLSP